MENLYAVFGLSPSATYEELKQTYRKLALIHHPDKCHNETATILNPDEIQSSATDVFCKISRAWKILGNSELRSAYDAAWKQRCIALEWPIQDSIGIKDFDVVHDLLTYPCRCGGVYQLSPQDVLFLIDYTCCTSCSLCIHIEYE